MKKNDLGEVGHLVGQLPRSWALESCEPTAALDAVRRYERWQWEQARSDELPLLVAVFGRDPQGRVRATRDLCECSAELYSRIASGLLIYILETHDDIEVRKCVLEHWGAAPGNQLIDTLMNTAIDAEDPREAGLALEALAAQADLAETRLEVVAALEEVSRAALLEATRTRAQNIALASD